MSNTRSGFISDGSNPGLAGLGSYELGDRSLSKGSKGADVRALQMALLSAGFKLPEWGPDSKYGDETANAVRDFQNKNGLPITGRADMATIKALQAKSGSGMPTGKTGIKIIDDAFDSINNAFDTAEGNFSWMTSTENLEKVGAIDKQAKAEQASNKQRNTVYWLAGGAAAVGVLGVLIAAAGDGK